MKTFTLLPTLAFLLCAAHAELPVGSPVAKRLAELKGSYEAAAQRDAGDAHSLAVKELNAKYAGALDRAITTATQAGKLDDALAIRAEKQLVTDGKPLCPDAEAGTAVKTLRATYRGALNKLEATRDQRLAPLRATLIKALDAYFNELTKAGDLDGTLAVKAARDSLMQAAAGPEREETVRDDGQPKHHKYDPSAAQKIIDWIISGNGSFRITTDGGKTHQGFDKDSADKLPKEKWELVRIKHGTGLGQSVPREPFPWDALDGVPHMQEFIIRQGPAVTREEIAHLHDLASSLEILNLGMLTIEDSLWPELPAYPKVRVLVVGEPDRPCNAMEESLLELLVQRFPNVTEFHLCNRLTLTGKGIETMLRWKGITHLSLTCDLDADAVAKLARFKDLRQLLISGRNSKVDHTTFTGLKALETFDFMNAPQSRNIMPALAKLPVLATPGCRGSEVTSGDLEPFRGHKRLTFLGLTSNRTIDDSAMDVVATLKLLRILDLRGTSVTDEGLSRLHGLKSLAEIRCADIKATPEGYAALKKALPKCKVLDK